KVLLRGEDITGASTHHIARLGVGIKTQVPNVIDGVSALDNILLAALRDHKPKAARAMTAETIERLQLTHIAHRLVGQLAHGQRQWVEIASVLVQEPDLILLDEPAAGMNNEEVRRTAELIREINRTKALIVVEHDMAFIRMIATGVTVLAQGEILMEGDVDTVLS
ncbi:ATP-binding cassette domain-containing protein, partial [Thioclava sp. BHET1]